VVPVGVIDSKVFRSGNSEAVRIPKEVAFGRDMDVTIERRGNDLIIRPKRPSVQEVIAKLRTMPAPPEIEIRDTEELPEPRGL
jgi:antitoxin VapB